MATIYDWSSTSADNDDAGTPINFTEGQLPSSVNNSNREMMKQIADWRNLLGGAKITATADTMTLTTGLSLAAYAQGNLFAFECGAANTTSVTIAVDGLAAKAIVKNYNVPLVAGDLVAGGIYVIAYEATAGNFQLISPVSTVPVTLAAAQTLTNKTLTSPVLNGTLSGTAFLDEDAMGSDSAFAAASQQSIRAYVDAAASSVDAAGAAASAAAALVSENAAAADLVLTNADVVLTNADVVSSAASAAQASAAAYGWTSVTPITAATTNLETTDARKYYLLDATSNTIAINLPAIGTDEGIMYGFEVVNVDNAITLVRDGTDYINGVNGNYAGLLNVGDVVYCTSDDASPDNWLVTFASRVTAGAGLTKTGSVMTLDLTNGQTWTGDQTFGPITETQTTKATSFTPSLTAEGTVYNCNAAITITMPS
jgi:hypothetical protein